MRDLAAISKGQGKAQNNHRVSKEVLYVLRLLKLCQISPNTPREKVLEG